MAISAKEVKALRDRTGAGMMDCKRALTEHDGDMEAAAHFLQKKGMASAAKKAGRTAAEGITLIHRSDDLTSATMLEVNSETDFVSRNDAFVSYVTDLVAFAHKSNVNSVQDLLGLTAPNGKTVEDWNKEMIGSIGENLQIRRLTRIDADLVSGYVHAGNQIAVLIGVSLDSKSAEDADEFGKNVAMHIAASNPRFLSDADIDPDVVAKRTAFLSEQALESGKPANIVEKMVVGRVNKWKKEITLLHQPYVRDPDLSIKKYQAKFGGVKITSYVRYQVAEGIEKKEANLAEEVAATLGK